MRRAAFLLVFLAGAPFLIAACGGGTAINRTIDDATITTRVKTALLNDTGVEATSIDVETTGGVVTLTGVVKSKEDEARVIEIVRKVAGVREVKSSLRVPQAVSG